MDDLMPGLIGVVIGCVLFIAFYVAVYCYRDMVFKKEAIKRNKSKGFVAMRLYREHVKAERERQSNKPDRLLGVMQGFFAELRERDKNHD